MNLTGMGTSVRSPSRWLCGEEEGGGGRGRKREGGGGGEGRRGCSSQ